MKKIEKPRIPATSLAIDRNSPVPRYYQLAEKIRSLIASKRLPPGAVLWSERRLLKDCGVSLTTVRQAYQLLIDDGLVVKEHGRGAFVADPAARTIVVKVVLDTSVFDERTWTELIAAFNRRFPHVKIHPLFSRLGDDYESILDGFRPDVFSVTESRIDACLESQRCLAAASLLERYPGTVEDVFPQAIDCFTRDGILWAIPYRFSALALFHNLALFEKLNVPRLPRQSSWDDVLDRARRLTVRKNDGSAKCYGFGVTTQLGFLCSVIEQNVPESVLPPDSKDYFKDPRVKEAVGFWIEDMVFRHRVSPPPLIRNDVDLFQRGKLAMIVGKYETVRKLSNGKSTEWDVAPLPEKEARSSSLAVQALAVSAKTVVADTAWNFVRFVASAKTQKAFNDSGQGLSVRRVIAKSNPRSGVFIKALAHSKAAWFYRRDPLRHIIDDEIRMLLAHYQNAEVTCNKIARRWAKMKKSSSQSTGV